MKIMIRVGIDLGADKIRLVTENEGLLFDEACMVALDQKGNVLAIGDEAKEMKESLDQKIRVISPLSKNKIDFDALHALLEQLIYDYKVFRMFKKTVLLFSYPMALNRQQREELKLHLLEFGAYRVYFEQEIWVAAIGAQLNLFIPVASCVLNLGSSNCDIAVFSNGQMQRSSQYKVAGRHVNLLIQKWLRQSCHMQISDSTAEKIKINIGQTQIQKQPKTMLIQGVNIQSQKLMSVQLDENMLVPVLYPLCEQWAKWIYQFLADLSPEQQEDVRMRGIICCGGTMLLKGLKENLQSLVNCPFYVTDDPQSTVPQGLEILLERMGENDAGR